MQRKMKFALFGNTYQEHKSAHVTHLLEILRHKEADICIHREFYEFLRLHTCADLTGLEIFNGHDDFTADMALSIGGDGTFRGALELSRMGIPVVGIPATIDNDIGCSNYTIGFDTACNTAIECIDKLRDTMQSHERCSVVEVMGRHAGYLALYVGIAVGATAVLIPERDVDFEKDVVERIRESRLAGNTHFMIVVAEGAGSAVEIGKRIQETVGIDPRVTVLGHIQRGGSPTARDRETASRMGYAAVKALAEGRMNCIVGTNEGHLVEIPIEKALNMTKHLQMERYEVLEAMHNQVPLKCGPIQ